MHDVNNASPGKKDGAHFEVLDKKAIYHVYTQRQNHTKNR